MNSYDAAWNAMCYLAALAVLLGIAYFLLVTVREAKREAEEQRRNEAKIGDE